MKRRNFLATAGALLALPLRAICGGRRERTEATVNAGALVYWDNKRGRIASPSHGLPSPFVVSKRVDKYVDGRVVAVQIEFQRVEESHV